MRHLEWLCTASEEGRKEGAEQHGESSPYFPQASPGNDDVVYFPGGTFLVPAMILERRPLERMLGRLSYAVDGSQVKVVSDKARAKRLG